MIWAVLILGALPGAVAHALYPRLTSRPWAWVLCFAMAAALAVLVAGTATFWWLPAGYDGPATGSRLAVSVLMGAVAGAFSVAAFAGLFGAHDPVDPRPLTRIVATAVSGILSFLLCRYLIELQRGTGLAGGEF